MKKKFKILIILIAIFLLEPHLLNAQTLGNAESNLSTVAGKAGVETVAIGTTVGSVVKGALSAVGLIFFILIFYGGFSWMIARGSEDKIKKARNTVVAAMIGLVVVLAAYAITAFVGGIIK